MSYATLFPSIVVANRRKKKLFLNYKLEIETKSIFKKYILFEEQTSPSKIYARESNFCFFVKGILNRFNPLTRKEGVLNI